MQNRGTAAAACPRSAPAAPRPPEIADSALFVALGEPVLILATRFQASLVGRDGELLAADAFARTLRHHGAHPLVAIDLADSFPGEVDLEWVTTLLPGEGLVRIAGPDNGLVVIIGTAAPDPDAALEMIASGRASWIRTNVGVVA